MFSLCLGLLLALISTSDAIPIDNGVEGDPEIECGASGITINFNIRNAFQGHVYVKGRFAEAGCRSDEGGRKVAGLVLPFSACGTDRSRSLNPRGVFVRQTVVISFHPQFLTKVDRAYTIQCFYMEADKTVSQQLEVSDITTAFQSQTVPMPVCRYDILEGGPTGQPIKFALIGQMVFHKWTCDSETTDIFCMLVHSCTVDDGSGNRANLLNENGCALDKFLLQNLEYSTDLMAGREAHVFKFADKAALFFSCQISITIKEPGAQCPRPQCGEPGGPGAGGIALGTGGPARPTAAPAARVTNAPIAAKVTNAPIAAKTTAAPAVKPPTAAPALAVVAAKPETLPPAVLVDTKPPTTSFTPEASTNGTPTPPPLATSTAGSPPPIVTAASTAGSPSVAPITASGATASSPAVIVQNDTALLISDEADEQTRRRRQARQRLDELGVWDVKAQPITALDLDDDSTTFTPIGGRPLNQPAIGQSIVQDYCLSPVSFSFIVASTVVFGLLAGALSGVLCLSRSSDKSSA